MKRITIGLATGALGIFLLALCVKAQSWQDMHNDEEAIEQGHEQLHHDMHELRNDLRNGDYGAAAHEQAEMNRRRAVIAERQEDLNSDIADQNYVDEDRGYGNGHYHWRHHRHRHDEDDGE